MRINYCILIVFIAISACKQSEISAPVTFNPLSIRDPKVLFSPEERYGLLFDSVQMSTIFQDSKTFLDCIPKMSTDSVLAIFETERVKPDFNLSTFVNQYFILPTTAADYVGNTSEPIEQYISNFWLHLMRKADTSDLGTLIQLPNPYIVQSGQSREIYYQDSYFTMVGLKATNQIDLLENMVKNFAHLIDFQGYVPSGNRTYYLSRTQPPYFACMVQLLASVKGDETYKKYLPQLEKEYQFWMDGKPTEIGKETSSKKRVVCMDGNVVNRYYGDEKPRPESFKEDKLFAKKSGQDLKPFYRHLRACSESGWDMSSRWLSDGKDKYKLHTTDIVPIDLNALLYNLELVIMKGKILDKKMDEAANYEKLSSKRREAVMRYCWSDDKQMFFDFDFQKYRKKETYSLAAAYPLYFKMVTKREADKIAENIEKMLLLPGGLVATNNTIGQKFDAPYSTAPLQWIAIQGLRNYGHGDLADDIKKRWIELCSNHYQSTGKILDRYNVADFNAQSDSLSSPTQDGYGYSNAILLKLLKEN